MLPLRTIAFLLSFFGASGLSLLVPVIGVANYLLIYQIYPEHAWWHKPIELLAIRYSMTAAVCLMLGILINLPRLPSVRPVVNIWDIAAVCLVFVVIFGEFTGLSQSPQSAVLTDKFIKMMIFVFCLTRVTTTKLNFTIVMWSLMLGSLYIGYDAWTAPRGAFARGRLEVVGGPDFRHSSGLAAHMSSMLPLIAAVFLTARSWFVRFLPAIAGALTVNTIVLCRTRSAFIGLFCGLITALGFVPKRRRIRVYTAIGVACVAAFVLTDDLFWERMATMQDRQTIESDKAAMGRIEIWMTARQVVAEFPMGVGIGNFPVTIQQANPNLGRRAAHNTFVLCATELGVQGLAIFIVILSTSILQVRYCYRRARETSDPVWTRYMAYGLLISIVISIGTQIFTERLYTESFWCILALPSCLKRVVLRETAVETVPLDDGPVVDINDWLSNNPLAADRAARGAFS